MIWSTENLNKKDLYSVGTKELYQFNKKLSYLIFIIRVTQRVETQTEDGEHNYYNPVEQRMMY